MLNLISNEHARNTISLSNTKKPISKQKTDFDIQVASCSDKHRNDIEQFIKQGFSQAYDAKISITMPLLLALQNGNYKAALGIRSGHHNLFVEQYILEPIEQLSIFIKQKIHRTSIVEIGHLYSNAKRFTIPLFMVTAVSLFYLNYKYLVFTGTEKVINLIGNSGVKYTYLCDAEQNKVDTFTDDWGEYYQTNPKVIAVSLSDVMSVIEQHPFYQKQFQYLDYKIARICQQLTSNHKSFI